MAYLKKKKDVLHLLPSNIVMIDWVFIMIF